MTERYISKPIHLLWAVAFLALGAVTLPFEDGWRWFGASMLLLGTATWVWIVFNGLWHSYELYWHEVAVAATALSKNANPAVWKAFGFEPPDSTFKAVADERKHGYGTTEIFDLPGTAPQFTTFASGALLGRSISEAEWSGTGKLYSVPVFRRLKKELETRKLITLKIQDKPTQGYVYTRKGKDFFLQCATVQTRDILRDKMNLDAPLPHRLPTGVQPVLPS